MSTTPLDAHCRGEILSESEKLLYIRLRDTMNHKKAMAELNKARAICGEATIPTRYNPYLTLSLGDHPNEHPLDFIMRKYWRPTKDLPISCLYFMKYGPDYLLGYLDGLENRDFGFSNIVSESYTRAYVDGYKQRLREAHQDRCYFKHDKFYPNGYGHAHAARSRGA